MLIRRAGFPEEGEILYCKVTKINPYSVFVNIVEYDKGGLINISEISPGRIRNIRDFVQLGKYVVCKVLRVDKAKGHIDLSLRRVTAQQKREKIQEIKQEQRAEKIIEFVANEKKLDAKKLFDEIWNKIKDEYYYLYEYLQDVVEGKKDIYDLGLKKDVAKRIKEIVEERIKPKEVQIKENIKISTYESNGVELIKKILLEAEKKGVEIYYLGGGKYSIIKKAKDYKEADKELKNIIDWIATSLKNKAVVEVGVKK